MNLCRWGRSEITVTITINIHENDLLKFSLIESGEDNSLLIL